jgi:hypothetical protein
MALYPYLVGDFVSDELLRDQLVSNKMVDPRYFEARCEKALVHTILIRESRVKQFNNDVMERASFFILRIF